MCSLLESVSLKPSAAFWRKLVFVSYQFVSTHAKSVADYWNIVKTAETDTETC